MITRPTLQELFARWQADLSARLGGAIAVPRRSLLAALGAALAATHHGLYAALLASARDSNPATATGDALADWATLWLPGGRRQAAAAIGNTVATGAPGAAIAAGSLLQDAAGNEYSVDTAATIGGGGSVSLSITSTVSGVVGNQLAGAVLSFVSPPSGVNADTTVVALVGGADLESDAEFLSRLKQRIQAPPHGGNADDYETWARSIAGVAKVWVFPLYSGLGSVRVYIAEASYSSVAPNAASAGLVGQVQSYIDSVRPVTAAIDSGGGVFVSGVSVVAPQRQPVNVTLSAGPDSASLRAAIEDSLRRLFERDARPEGTVRISRIRECVSQTAGEEDNEISSPVASVTADAGKILVLGTVTWP